MLLAEPAQVFIRCSSLKCHLGSEFKCWLIGDIDVICSSDRNSDSYQSQLDSNT